MASQEQQPLINSLQQEKLDRSDEFTRSLDLLATGLFTRQGQFFYELIQNAEDCAHPERDTRVEIVLQDNALIFRNNGELFDEDDVRNICSVGRTQKKSEDENIGFWGIGFKSVFRVTEQPHIFSGDFQFKFDRNYWESDEYERGPDEIPWHVTPIWIDDLPVETRDDWNTFYLPYIGDEYKDRVLEGIEQLENRLLLFLEDIEEIVIRDEIEDDKDRDQRYVVDNRDNKLRGREVTLSSGETWWVYTKTFDVPDYVREDRVTRERQRHTIEEREARIALKVGNDGHLDHLTEGSVHTSVFSFLPIQGVASGMPFIIDADLLTGAGRTKPHQDAEWNDWMLREIGSTLVPEAIDQLKTHEDWKYEFQNALFPSQRPDSELFRILDRTIIDIAEEKKVIPTEDGNWVTPDNAIHPIGENSEALRELLSVGDTRKITESHLTHERFNMLRRLVTERLRIDQLTADPETIRTVGTPLAEFALNQDWLESKAENKDSEWFASLYDLLSISHKHDDEFQQTKIAYDGFTLHKPDNIYLEFDEDVKDVLEEIHAEEVFKTVPNEVIDTDGAREFLERMGVDSVGPSEIAADIIAHPEMLTAKADNEDVSDWFRDLYGVLTHSGMSEALSEIPIVYTGNSVVSPASENTSILLPAEGDRVGELLDTVGESLTGIETVPEEIVNPEHSGDEKAERFLSSLGIQRVSPYWIANNKLLPKIEYSEEWESGDPPLDVQTLVTYTGVVNAEIDPSEFDGEIAVATIDDGMQPASNVVFSSTYGAVYDTRDLLDIPVISASYQNTEYGDNWRTFFEEIGINPEDSASNLQTALNNLSEVDSDPRNILPEIYATIDNEQGQNIDLSEIQLFTHQGTFQPATDLYLPDHNLSKRIFPDENFVLIPGEDPEIKEGLQNLGISSASEEFRKELDTGRQLDNPVDPAVEDRIQERWDEVADLIPSLPIQPPEISWVKQVEVTYFLGEQSQTQQADRVSYYDGDILYFARNFGHNWSDLAKTLDGLTAEDIDISSEEIENIFMQSVEEAAVSQVIRYETDRGRVEARDVREDRTLHAGYDVFTKNPETGKERHIEIKSFSSPGTASMRERQREQAINDDDFYLYIVIRPRSPDPELWFKRSPEESDLKQHGANEEEILTIPRKVWSDLWDGPIPLRRS